MNKVCALETILFFILFVAFLIVALYVFNLSYSAILRYQTVSHTNITNFFIDSIASVTYLFLTTMFLLMAGIALYGVSVSLFYCEEDYF